jgi:hypothetical protein
MCVYKHIRDIVEGESILDIVSSRLSLNPTPRPFTTLVPINTTSAPARCRGGNKKPCHASVTQSVAKAKHSQGKQSKVYVSAIII